MNTLQGCQCCLVELFAVGIGELVSKMTSMKIHNRGKRTEQSAEYFKLISQKTKKKIDYCLDVKGVSFCEESQGEHSLLILNNTYTACFSGRTLMNVIPHTTLPPAVSLQTTTRNCSLVQPKCLFVKFQ